MKVGIVTDEWYPVYSFTLNLRYNLDCEITEELYERYTRIMAEFSELQDELEKLDESTNQNFE